MTNSKKRKIILGTCIPAAALGVAGAVTGIVLAMQKTTDSFDEKTQIKLTFNAGSGEFEANSTTSKIVDKNTSLSKVSTPVVQKSGAVFAGWKDENGAAVRDDVILTKSATLTATYSDETPGEMHVITFEKGDADILSGNLTVAIASGKEFVNVNRPYAEKANSVFESWIFAEACTGHNKGEVVKETDVVQTDWKLEPKFTETVQISFSAAGKQWESGASSGTEVTATYSGSTTPYYEKTATWGNVNKPVATSGALYFEYFCSDEECTTKIADDAAISTIPATVYPRFTSAPTESYSILNFTTKAVKENKTTAIDVVYAGNPTQATLFDTQWKNMNKPVPSVSGSTEYEVVSWQWVEAASESVTTGWADIADTTSFPKITTAGNHYYIRPVMKVKAAGVVATGATSAIVGQNTLKYKAWVQGTTTDTLTFKLLYNTGTRQDPSWSDAGVSTYGSLSKTSGIAQGEEVTLTVNDRDTSNDVHDLKINIMSATDDSKWTSIIVYVDRPTVNSDKVWYHANSKWWSVTQAELCAASGTSTITPYDVNGTAGTATTIAAFNQTVVLGDNITEVPDNFLAGCVAMESGNVDLNKATVIGDNFMEGCTKFQTGISGLAQVTKIGNGFMEYCDVFNQALTLTACESIGEDFLFHCDAFNSTITFPAITKIGDGFLQGCKAFTQDITFPATLTEANSVGDYCMRGCEAYTGTITVNCKATVFVANDYSFSSSSITAIRTTGFQVTGTYTDDFIAKFGDKADGTHGIYRKVTGAVTGLTITGSTSVTKGGSIADLAAEFLGPQSAEQTWEIDTEATPTKAAGTTITYDATSKKATLTCDAAETAQSIGIKVTIAGVTAKASIIVGE